MVGAMQRRNHQAQRWMPANREPYFIILGGDITRLQAKRSPEHERWMPKHGDQYFLILGDSTVKRFQWHGTDFDQAAWKFGNCFRAWREAEQARDALQEVLLTFHWGHA